MTTTDVRVSNNYASQIHPRVERRLQVFLNEHPTFTTRDFHHAIHGYIRRWMPDTSNSDVINMLLARDIIKIKVIIKEGTGRASVQYRTAETR